MCAALALAAVVAGVLRLRLTAAELAVGALIVPVGSAAAATVMFPMAAMNLQWPAIAGCAGALAVIGLKRRQHMGLLRWVAVLLAAVPVVVVLMPLTEAVWAAMGMELAAGLAVLMGIAFVSLVPTLEPAARAERMVGSRRRPHGGRHRSRSGDIVRRSLGRPPRPLDAGLRPGPGNRLGLVGHRPVTGRVRPRGDVGGWRGRAVRRPVRTRFSSELHAPVGDLCRGAGGGGGRTPAVDRRRRRIHPSAQATRSGLPSPRPSARR